MSSLELTLSKILKLGKLRHPASDYLGEHQKQKFSPCFRFGARKIPFNMEVKILFLVFGPQGLGQLAELEFGLGQSKTVMCWIWIWSGLGGLGFCLYEIFLAVQEGAGGMHGGVFEFCYPTLDKIMTVC